MGSEFMGNDICWLKRYGNFFTASSAMLSSALWQSIESLGARCVDSGNAALGESIVAWAKEIELFASNHGELAKSGEGHAKWVIQRMAEEQTMQRMAEVKAMQRMAEFKTLWSNEYATHVERGICAIKKEAPQSWLDDTAHLVIYAKKSTAVAKLVKNSLPTNKAAAMLEASMAGGDIAAKAAQMEQAKIAVKKLARSGKWGAKAAMELEMFEQALGCFGKKMQYAERGGEVEVVKDQGRFCAKKAYALYLPESGSRREGFVGAAIGQLGADLGAAKLYESVERARLNLERGDHGGAAVVEIEIKVSGIHGERPKETGNGLLEALAEHESQEMKLEIARADIERMQARIKELESMLGIESSPETKAPKAKRSL